MMLLISAGAFQPPSMLLTHGNRKFQNLGARYHGYWINRDFKGGALRPLCQLSPTQRLRWGTQEVARVKQKKCYKRFVM